MVRHRDVSAGTYRDGYEEDSERRARRSRRDYKEPRRKRAPFLLRLFSWLGVILLCFVAGYLGTSLFLDWPSLLKPENRIENQEDLKNLEEAEKSKPIRSPDGNIQQISLNLYYIKDGAANVMRQNFVSRTQEDNIRDALDAILTMSGISGTKGPMTLLHLFRSADTIFLDFPSAFASKVSAMEEVQRRILFTCIVRTMEENFPPINKIRFLIDSTTVPSGDLSVPWYIP